MVFKKIKKAVARAVPLLIGLEGGVTMLAAYRSHNTPLLPRFPFAPPLERGT